MPNHILKKTNVTKKNFTQNQQPEVFCTLPTSGKENKCDKENSSDVPNI